MAVGKEKRQLITAACRMFVQHLLPFERRSGSKSISHHAVAEALHLELANVASPFAVVLLLAYHLVTPLLRRRSVLDF